MTVAYDGPHGWQWIPLAGVYALGAIVNWLSGKKTYIGCIGFVVLAAFQFYTGHPAQGFQYLTAAWTAMGLRSAVAKLQAKA